MNHIKRGMTLAALAAALASCAPSAREPACRQPIGCEGDHAHPRPVAG